MSMLRRQFLIIGTAQAAGVLAVAQTAGGFEGFFSPWANFNPGSWQKSKVTIESKGIGHETTGVIEIKETLVSKTADKAVLEIQTGLVGGTIHATKEKIPLSSGITGTAKPVAPPKMGTDTLTLAGKTFKCATVEYQTEAHGTKSTIKRWIAEEVPGGFVKTETTASGATSSRLVAELVDFKAM